MSDSCDKLGTSSSDYKADSGISSGFISTETFSAESDGLVVITEEIEDVKDLEELSKPTTESDDSAVVTEEVEDVKSLKEAKLGEIKPNNVSKDDFWKRYYTQFSDGDTLLHEAIAFCMDPDVIRKMIQHAPDPSYLDIQNQKGEAPIHLATKGGQYDVIRDLLVAGCKPGTRDIFGNSALHIACRIGNINAAITILEPIEESETKSMNLKYEIRTYPRMDLEQWNYVGQTCVHIATIQNKIDILRYLCTFGADINAREGLMGFAPIHYAYQYENQEMIDFLTKECPNIDLNIKTYRGLTAKELNSFDTDDEEEYSEGESVEELEDGIDRLGFSL